LSHQQILQELTMKNIFEKTTAQEVISRINQLTPQTQGQWGKMQVAQMLAHCNVAYDMSFTDQYKKPGTIARFMLKAFVKRGVVGPKPYPKNSRTAPQFIVEDTRNFEAEKQKLINYIEQCTQHGATYFEGKESHSFGKMTSSEWNVMFYKHLDHHLTQFGV